MNNVVSVLAGQAPVDNKILNGEEVEASTCETPGNMFSAPVPSSGGSGNTKCGLDWQVEDFPVICNSGASCHKLDSSTGMINYREADATMRTASGKRYPIEGFGGLPLTFRSSSGEVTLLLHDVVHAPSLSYHLISLRVVADDRNTNTGNKTV